MKRVAFVGALAALGVPRGRARAADAAPVDDPLRVGMTGDYRPYALLGSDGTWSGLDVDVARALASARGTSLTIVQTSWPTLTADLLAGAFDLAMGGVSADPKRAAAGAFSAPYVVDGKVALVRAADRALRPMLADFNAPAVRVAVNPGGTNEAFVREHVPLAHVDVVASNRSIPELVASGAADVMFTDGVEAALAARADGRLVVLNANAPYTHLHKVYFARKDADALLAFVDAQLLAWERAGRLAAWRMQWIGSNLNDPTDVLMKPA